MLDSSVHRKFHFNILLNFTQIFADINRFYLFRHEHGKKNCFALFIGINAYQHPAIPRLNGCVRDAQRMLNYIQKNWNADAYNLNVKTLLTGTENLPTRQNIINHIRQHLGQAKAGDTVLLFYAGHGSKEKAHPYFGETNGESQTIVPCDARTEITPGQKVKNILDKEIRYLFYNIWKEHRPEIIFIQDSCHATGATRIKEEVAEVLGKLQKIEAEITQETEQISELEKPVPRFVSPTDYELSGSDWAKLDTKQLANLYTAFDEEALVKISTNVQTGKIPFETNFPLAEHLHLAACDEHQSAYELPTKGGVFTCHLLDILEAGQNTISYHDLFNRIRMNIGGVYKQSPDLYVHSKDFKKRHELFLGDLLQHQKLLPYRDIDVFKGFFPLVPKDRNGWQIKAGEMELLPSIEGTIEPIPIEVFPIDQVPTGKSNAVINYVAAGYSQVVFTTANFDPEIYKNKLYAMIPPRFLRRWRVAVCVEGSASKIAQEDVAKEKKISLFETFFKEHTFVKDTISYEAKAKAKLSITTKLEEANYIVKELNNWYYLLALDKTVLLQFTAAVDNKDSNRIVMEIIKKNNDDIIYKYKKDLTPFNLTEDYTLTTKEKPSISGLFYYVLNTYGKQPKKEVKFFFIEDTTSNNAFVEFQQQQAKTLAYYDAFINWTTLDQADYCVATENKGFAVYPLVKNKEGKKEKGTTAAFRKTNSLNQQEAFRTVLGLQRISKWRTVINVYNKLQTNILANHRFVFSLKFKDQTCILDSSNSAHYNNQERGEFKPFNPLMNLQNLLTEQVLQMDLDIMHQQGKDNIYISALLLDSHFGVLPLQTTMGCNLLKPQNTLKINNIQLPIKGIPNEVYYIKIFMAYQRFDISGLLQDALPADTNSQEEPSTKEENRSIVQKPPKTEETGAWMTFLFNVLMC